MSGGASLTRDAIAAVDPQDMLGDVLAQPHQIGDALWRTEAAQIPARDMPGGLIVCGMGGSAIGGDLARGAIGSRARRSLRVVRDYELLPGVGDDALILCASYSGNTEETLAAFDAARATGAPMVVLTTGGELAARARDASLPVIGVPSGMQPRAAVVYMAVAAMEVAAAAGVVDSLRAEIEGAAALLEELVAEWGPDADESSSEAKRIARHLDASVPVIYGGGPTAPVAQRWKTQINENAMAPAFAAVLPEADHNDICGWQRAGSLGPLAAVFLDDEGIHPAVRRRIALTDRIVRGYGQRSEVVVSRGANPVERMLSLVLLGDLVSVYVAVLAGVDPTPVDVLEQLKKDLAAPA